MLLLPIATLMAATAVEGRIRHRQVKKSFLYTKKIKKQTKIKRLNCKINRAAIKKVCRTILSIWNLRIPKTPLISIIKNNHILNLIYEY
jgi:hypothetical protein